jgi:TonB family protein
LPPVAKNESTGKEAASTKTETRLPRLLRQIDPVYPPEALRDRIAGDVTLNLTVGFTGKVERAVVVKSVPKLDAAAVTAARQWEFEPGLYEGIPIQATLQVTIHFSLPPEAYRTKETLDPGKTKTVEIPPPSEPQDDLSRASGLLERGFPKEALAAARKFLASNPNSPQAKSIALDAVIQLGPVEF